jgi:glycerate kinase
MRTIVVIPDSFKGTMSSVEVCAVMRQALQRHLPDARVVTLPVADGGEGSVDAYLAAVGGQRVTLAVTGPMGTPVDSFYGRLDDGAVVIEMAAAAGLPLVKGPLTPAKTTTYGVGELMVAAARAGATRLVVGLGGSATTDMGCGAAAAAGVRFLDADGQSFLPLSGDLGRHAHIDASGLDPALAGAEITVMCDIDNPLYGPRGAAYIFGPQKGADPAMVEFLDQGLRHACHLVERDLGRQVGDLPGAGAAGGMGAGMVAFFGGELRLGIDVVLEVARFDEVVRGADLVLTGEGRIDAQSLSGKVVVGVARRCGGVPGIAIVGGIGEGFEPAYDQGLTAV